MVHLPCQCFHMHISRSLFPSSLLHSPLVGVENPLKQPSDGRCKEPCHPPKTFLLNFPFLVSFRFSSFSFFLLSSLSFPCARLCTVLLLKESPNLFSVPYPSLSLTHTHHIACHHSGRMKQVTFQTSSGTPRAHQWRHPGHENRTLGNLRWQSCDVW